MGVSHVVQHQTWRCALCGYLPPISPSSTPLIQEFLAASGNFNFGYVLQVAGILSDTHLRILLGFEPKERTEFFKPHGLIAVDLMILTDLLHKFATETRPWATLSLAGRFPRKRGLESHLCKATTRPKLIAHSMRFSEEEYTAIRTRIKQYIPWYLEISCGFEEQEPEKTMALVRKVCDDYPIFDLYEDAWPIQVILKRILNGYDDISDYTTIEPFLDRDMSASTPLLASSPTCFPHFY
ncbi:hypothetical protein MSAN_01383400 [Mycena sanguinolenta]|uniref:Uncharacterized protein n=1 Tax=Mycena sanguinolenta TaxID=230812 RepID=A0A8H6YA64_9AGAR|nr:hypothetical protein MSAN_01383400 [Mycena sanguinolenta]